MVDDAGAGMTGTVTEVPGFRAHSSWYRQTRANNTQKNMQELHCKTNYE